MQGSLRVFIFLAWFIGPAFAEPFELYWADGGNGLIPDFGNGRLERASLDGENRETIFFDALDRPRGIALDTTAGHVYWTSDASRSIQRSNLDGSSVETILSWTGLPASLGDIDIDPEAGKIYWTDQVADSIRRANLDGSNIEDLVTIDEDSAVVGVALDLFGGKMYWTDRLTLKIQRANLDGSDIEDLIVGGIDNPNGIAIDPVGEKMYFTDAGKGGIARANLDGSDFEALVLADRPFGITLDLLAGQMYWSEFGVIFGGTPRIMRSNLDGSAIEEIISMGLDSPRHLALIPEPTTLSLLAVALLISRRRPSPPSAPLR